MLYYTLKIAASQSFFEKILKNFCKKGLFSEGNVVSFDFRFTDQWTLKFESPKLRDFVIRTTESVGRRMEVGDYWDFRPDDGGLGLPPELEEKAPKTGGAPIA